MSTNLAYPKAVAADCCDGRTYFGRESEHRKCPSWSQFADITGLTPDATLQLSVSLRWFATLRGRLKTYRKVVASLVH